MPGQFVGKLQTSSGGDNDGLHGVADLHLDRAVRIGQVLELDRRLALSANVDESNVRSQSHDLPFD